MSPLSPIDDGCHNHDFFSVTQSHDGIGHLLDCLLADGLAALRAERFPGTGIQQSQVIVDFCDRPYSRPGIPARRLLIDRNSRRQPFNVIDIGLIHLSQELAGIR